jgi:hypothetical protein
MSKNRAIGGATGDGSHGGNGLGGGVFNDATASLRPERSTVKDNRANGGEGIGGGVYNLGDFVFDVLTLIYKNHASTSHDNVFDIEL